MLIEDLQDVAVVEVFLAALGVTRIEEARVDVGRVAEQGLAHSVECRVQLKVAVTLG